MAFIGKIRNNMWLVFVIIGLATASFILMDAMGSSGMATTQTPIGVINGEKITNLEFERAHQTLFTNATDANVSRAALWDYFVEQKIVNAESEALGLTVTKDELMDLQFGQNISPIVYQNFINPQTGLVDQTQLQSIRQSIENGQPMAPQFRQFWAEQEKQVIKTQLQTKLNNAVLKSVYSPNWLASNAYSEENSTVDMAVVKIPFDQIPATDVTVTDNDIKSYIADNKQEFELKDEMRELAYVAMDVLPTGADSALWIEDMDKLITNFAAAEDDSSFVLSNNGLIAPRYESLEEIEESYQNALPSWEVGKVYGPTIIRNSYQAVKLIDKRIVPDSVSASHILKRATPGVAAEFEAANAFIDSLMATMRYVNSTRFAAVATEVSDDIATKEDGGSLGTIVQGAMLPAFNDLFFLDGKEGGLYKLETQFGVHLIYIDDLVYLNRRPKYKLGYVNIAITPSKATQDEKYEEMVDLVSQYPYLEELKAAVEADPNLRIERSGNVGKNDYAVGNLGAGNTSRDIVKWAFDGETSLNDISPSIFTFTDPINYFNNRYVVAGLESIRKPGLPSAADMRNDLEFVVLNKKKAEKFMSSLSATSLAAVASSNSVEVDTILNVNMLNNFVPGLGAEPMVLGRAFGQDIGAVSKPILGNSGVFLVSTIAKNEAGTDVPDVSFIRNSLNAEAKSQLQFKLVNALKDKVKIKDNRSIFY